MPIWRRQHRVQDVPISGPMLQHKASMFTLKIGLDDFKASKEWLDHLKSSHIITLHKIYGKSEAVPAGLLGNWLPVLQGILRCTISPGMCRMLMRQQSFSTSFEIGR
ncbi:hypothetical protein PR048_005974 [Dryococelus australis]|uniref:HTH CENPB-type domain-containing protein n=1 Tax=Dryococelus australis TaxID=614101 RepID=A0ABQ9I9Q0_9NEOP|nr:hypothetical protein PR048_005974 [Dryococelus australis]